MKIEAGKKVIYTPSPYMLGTTCYVPDPIRCEIVKVKYVSPINHRIEYIVIKDKQGKTYTANENQILSRYPTVYNFI